MSQSDSVINPEKFDELVRIHRILGSIVSKIDSPFLKTLEKMIESEYPCSLVRLEDSTRLWMNNKFIEQGLEVNIEKAIGRDVNIFWLPEDLEELKKMVVSCNLTTGFDWCHQAAIYPPVWGKFSSHFDRVESNVGVCRLAIYKEFEEIPHPLIKP